MEDIDKLLKNTLWTDDCVFVEHIDATHILRGLLDRWNQDGHGEVYTTALPGPANAARNQESKAGKAMTQPINLVPVKIGGALAMRFGDPRSFEIYKQWRERVDSMPDYISTMARRGRYVGRLQQGMGV